MGTTIDDHNDDEAAKKWVQQHLTAMLTTRPSDEDGHLMRDHIDDNFATLLEEADYHWHPSKDYFPDCDDPRRLSFTDDLSKLNYCMDANDNFTCPKTQIAYRRWQLANQVHHCCFTCWKYNAGKNKRTFCRRCRFGFPVWAITSSCIVI